ncbi:MULTISPECIES: cytochrome bd-I oxidase subunit CydX [Pseudovibrio]|uniref:cytochrome bd-I oxidase subunit CydX n=1 Tax=Stappiaceae TaxID=2821832 RepID=UPI002365EA6A|nr:MULTISPECIES: cytochrome bd-I oxidase subunit CydX [Pseudovibrio]MDD7912148.1 cytochrome bd-I oxidase subunit CydX [Pseudovibrio exalbescens]MDX5592878.1 cytochrome bd-I oxidase subunit CydX [Pseudovibrio sp. SPO723]
MWYFAWILGLGFAALFAVVNAMWLEFREDERNAPALKKQVSPERVQRIQS